MQGLDHIRPATPSDELDQKTIDNKVEDASEHEDHAGSAVFRAALQRAEAAESSCQALQQQVAELQAQLAAAREALDHAERRHRIDLMLIEADAIDLDTARLLIELTQPEHDGDPAKALAALRREKPFLFRRSAAGPRSGAPGVMSPEPELRVTEEGMRLIELAEHAAETGDRRALLRYLQARRRH
jgi:multidrug efflux pump subunit AcrA (membrane-fusion protein)